MRLKVLETLAAGKAVVASSLAVEGLDVVNGETLWLAESDAEFCQAVSYLLAHPEKRVAMAKQAREWACVNVTWDKSIDEYDALHARLIKNPQHPLTTATSHESNHHPSSGELAL
jgi:glycosyltransferase involved in cell wall biosynthesis